MSDRTKEFLREIWQASYNGAISITMLCFMLSPFMLPECLKNLGIIVTPAKLPFVVVGYFMSLALFYAAVTLATFVFGVLFFGSIVIVARWAQRNLGWKPPEVPTYEED